MKKNSSIVLIFILLSILFFLILPRIQAFFSNEIIDTNAYKIEGDVPPIPKKDSLTLIMAGDALYHEGVYKDGLKNKIYDFKHQLEFIKPIVLPYDLAYYNQESILGGTELGLSTYPRFNSPYEVGDAFVDAGFNLVSTANNHTLDRGKQAILNSYHYWHKQTDVVSSGTCDTASCNKIGLGEKNNIRYAFLSYTTSTNGIPIPKNEEFLVNLYSDEQAKKDIQSIKETVDVIIVAMHWGTEYKNEASEEQVRIAHYLSSLGVHLIIGNHPHVIEPIEKIGETVVFYSLGNFISAQTGIDKLIGLMPSLTINKETIEDEVVITIDDIKAELTYTSYNKSFRDFKIIPFSKMDASILVHYQQIEKDKKTLLASYGVSIP